MAKYWKRLQKKEARTARRAEERKNREAKPSSSAGSAAFSKSSDSNSSYPAKSDKTLRRAARAAARAAQAQAQAAASQSRQPAPFKPEQGGLSRRFNAWADGSALAEGRHMGAGWLVEEVLPSTEKVETAREFKAVTEPRFNGTSTFAELAAATAALNAIPAGSRVRLHLDCMTVIEVLNDGTIEKNLGASKRHKDMRAAGKELFNAVARHESVVPVKVSDKKDPNQRVVHRLSREGSSEAERINRGGFGSKPL